MREWRAASSMHNHTEIQKRPPAGGFPAEQEILIQKSVTRQESKYRGNLRCDQTANEGCPAVMPFKGDSVPNFWALQAEFFIRSSSLLG